MMIGFGGLGNLGSAMARRLAGEGVELTVWNRTAGKAAGLGTAIASSPSQLMTLSEIVFLNLFDSVAVEHVLTGKDGLLYGKCEGKIVVDTSTNHPSAVLKFHSIVRQAGARYLEAPVLGSVGPASEGALTMVVSGEKSALETVRPIAEKLCRRIVYLEGEGKSTRMKLINNHVLGTIMAVIAEAGAVGEKCGIPLGTVLEVLSIGAGNSPVLFGKKEKLTHGDYSAQFSAMAILKDLNYFDELSTSLGMASGILRGTKDAYEETVRQGLGEKDFSVVYRVFKKDDSRLEGAETGAGNRE